MSEYVSAQMYNKYKRRILEMSPAIQYYEGTSVKRDSSCLSDLEIAGRLELDVDDVTQIRCMAELDLLPSDTWAKSAEWKKERVEKARGKHPTVKRN